MTLVQLTELVTFFIGLSIYTGVVSLHHSQCVDEVRSDLFGLRDETFIYAADNGLLNTQAYKLLRKLMNSFIRYAHRLTITRVVLLSLGSKLVPPDSSSSFLIEWQPALDELAPSHREQMRAFYRRHEEIIVINLIHRSLILRALLRLYTVYYKHNRGITKETVANEVASHVNWRAMETEAACV